MTDRADIDRALRDDRIGERTRLEIIRLWHLDPAMARSKAIFELAAMERRDQQAEERRQASETRQARRTIETTAPGLSVEDHMAIRKVMIERKCDPFEAATTVGQQRLAAKAAK